MNFRKAMTLAAAAIVLAPIPGRSANQRPTYEEMAASADKVVVGTVGVKSSRWGDDAHIYTEVLIQPDLTIKGANEGPVVVELLGGTVGEDRMTVSDGPELPDGERVVVFLKRESGRYAVVGRAAGAVKASSAEAANAIEGAFTSVERARGRRMSYERGLAAAIVGRGGSGSTSSQAQVGCYSTDGAKWGTISATYKIGTSVPADWAASIDASAGTWNAAGAGFRLVNDASSVNELSYKDLVAAYGSSYNNTYAVTTTWSSRSGQISRATIEINTKWPWSTSGEANKADVQNILTHEFGHWMRLLDIYSPSTCSSVTMWGSAAFGETSKRTLEQADLDGFFSLYAAGSGTPPPSTVTAPSLVSPSNGATGIGTSPTLSWTASSNATSYDVYLGTSNSPALAGTVTGTSGQASGLSDGVYYWRVVAKNGTSSASSPTYSFTVGSTNSGNGGTSAMENLLSPSNGATGVPTSTLMEWSAVTGATSYDVYVGLTPNPGRIGRVGGTSATVSGFRPGTTYYWKVVARTASGAVSSAVWSFRTQ